MKFFKTIAKYWKSLFFTINSSILDVFKTSPYFPFNTKTSFFVVNILEFQAWFLGTWLPEIKSWLFAYRPKDLIMCSLNNRTNRINEEVKISIDANIYLLLSFSQPLLRNSFEENAKDMLKGMSCFPMGLRKRKMKFFTICGIALETWRIFSTKWSNFHKQW